MYGNVLIMEKDAAWSEHQLFQNNVEHAVLSAIYGEKPTQN